MRALYYLLTIPVIAASIPISAMEEPALVPEPPATPVVKLASNTLYALTHRILPRTHPALQVATLIGSWSPAWYYLSARFKPDICTTDPRFIPLNNEQHSRILADLADHGVRDTDNLSWYSAASSVPFLAGSTPHGSIIISGDLLKILDTRDTDARVSYTEYQKAAVRDIIALLACHEKNHIEHHDFINKGFAWISITLFNDQCAQALYTMLCRGTTMTSNASKVKRTLHATAAALLYGTYLTISNEILFNQFRHAQEHRADIMPDARLAQAGSTFWYIFHKHTCTTLGIDPQALTTRDKILLFSHALFDSHPPYFMRVAHYQKQAQRFKDAREDKK